MSVRPLYRRGFGVSDFGNLLALKEIFGFVLSMGIFAVVSFLNASAHSVEDGLRKRAKGVNASGKWLKGIVLLESGARERGNWHHSNDPSPGVDQADLALHSHFFDHDLMQQADADFVFYAHAGEERRVASFR